MALSRGRRYEPVNYWPGFVDALSTMLLVIIFLLSVFMLAQFFLSREVTGKDEALTRLNRQIEELTNLLALERTQKGADESRIATLTATLDSAERAQKRLKDEAADAAASADAAGRAAATASALDSEKADLRQGARRGRRPQSADRRAAQATRRDRGRARRVRNGEQGVAVEDRRPRPAAQRRARPEGAGAQPLPLGFLRPPAADSRLASGHPGGRRPVRVRILGAVRRRQGRHQSGGQAIARFARRGRSRPRARDPARHPLDLARRRAHRQPADQRNRPIQVELGAFRGPRGRRGAISRLQGRGAGPARRRRLRRIPADRSGNRRRRRWRATAASS